MCLVFSIVLALVVEPHSINRICHVGLSEIAAYRHVVNLVWSCVLLVTAVALSCAQMRCSRAHHQVNSRSIPSKSDVVIRSTETRWVIRTLAITNQVRFFTRVVNASQALV